MIDHHDPCGIQPIALSRILAVHFIVHIHGVKVVCDQAGYRTRTRMDIHPGSANTLPIKASSSFCPH